MSRKLYSKDTLSSSGPSHPMPPPTTETRKEKSRDAARSRRGKENYEYYELAKMLPLPGAITMQLDKASVIRLTVSYLRIKDFSANGDPPWLPTNIPIIRNTNEIFGSDRNRSRSHAPDHFEQHQGTHILQSLDGFAFALAADGRFLYISETVSIYLGLSQVEMTGSSVFDYIHSNDHIELAEQLGLDISGSNGTDTDINSSVGDSDGDDALPSNSSANNNLDISSTMSIRRNSHYTGSHRTFCIRMKSTLSKRGSCHLKFPGYRVILVLCKFRAEFYFSPKQSNHRPILGIVALGIALYSPALYEFRLESHMFMVKMTCDLRIVYCEPRILELLNFEPEEIVGINFYNICHAQDAGILRKCHVDLLNKGQAMSGYYRLLNKNGGYLWIQTCATIISNSKNPEEQSIICINYVLSEREFPLEVFDTCQVTTLKTVVATPVDNNGICNYKGSTNRDSAVSMDDDDSFSNSSGSGFSVRLPLDLTPSQDRLIVTPSNDDIVKKITYNTEYYNQNDPLVHIDKLQRRPRKRKNEIPIINETFNLNDESDKLQIYEPSPSTILDRDVNHNIAQNTIPENSKYLGGIRFSEEVNAPIADKMYHTLNDNRGSHGQAEETYSCSPIADDRTNSDSTEINQSAGFDFTSRPGFPISSSILQYKLDPSRESVIRGS